MTFDEIVAMIALDLNIATTNTVSFTRIGTHVNRRYRQVMRRLGMNVFSRGEFDFDCVPGTALQTIPDDNDPVITRVVSVFYQADATTRPRALIELSYDEIKQMVPTTDIPTHWAPQKMGSDTVTFRINSTVPDGLTLIIEAELSKSTLAGSDVPEFSEEFHEILVKGGKADELLKMEKPTLSRVLKDEFIEDLNELSLKAVIGAHADIVQNKYGANRRRLRGTRW